MPVDRVARRSRRSFIAAAVGGAAGLLAGRFSRPEPAAGAAGSALILGSETNNAGTANTQVIASSNVVTFKLLQNGPGTGLMGHATPASGLTRGVYGRVESPNGDGLQGRNAGASGTGAAVRAYGGSNVGVAASSDTGDGITATTGSADRVAILARNLSAETGFSASPAVRGLSAGAGEDLVASFQTYPGGGEFAGPSGVVGVAVASSGNGVAGLTAGSSGIGVYGLANNTTGGNFGVLGETGSLNGIGVYGIADGGTGIRADSNTGTALSAWSTSGIAADIHGPAVLRDRLEMQEIGEPATPGSNVVRVFVRDAGGTTQLCAKFADGSVVVIAAPPP